MRRFEAEIRRREEVLRQTFRRYVSPKVADKILEDGQLRDTLLSTADALLLADVDPAGEAPIVAADGRGALAERARPRSAEVMTEHGADAVKQ